MSDLSLMACEELYKEISNRNDAIVILTLKRISDKEEQLNCYYTGGTTTAIGMTVNATTKLRREYAEA